MPAVDQLAGEHADGRDTKTDAERAEGQAQAGQSDQDRAGRLQQGDVQVVVRGPDEDEQAHDDERLGRDVQQGDVLHPFEALEQPDREQPHADDASEREEIDRPIGPEPGDGRHEQRQDPEAQDHQQELQQQDGGEDLRNLLRIVPVHGDLPRRRETEPIVRQDEEIHADGAGHLGQAVVRRAQDPEQIGQCDQRRQVVGELDDGKREEVAQDPAALRCGTA